MSIGETLAAARREAGLTVEQVSTRTRVRQTIIDQIEHDNFSGCGGDFYARGHIRGIARVVGVDPEPLVEEFDALHGHVAPNPTQIVEFDAMEPRRRRPNWSAAMGLALVVAFAYGLIQLFSGEPATTQGTTLTQDANPPRVASKPSAPPSTPGTETTPGEPIAQLPRDKVSVRLAVENGVSWVSVTNGSGEQLFEGLLEEGTVREFTHEHEVKLILGNAAAVQLSVNGHDLGTPGDSGEVVRLSFGPEDPRGAG
ncbi:MAG: helix-turn-helix domain-containing protein [Carbonactinosporaceae bacterium]